MLTFAFQMFSSRESFFSHTLNYFRENEQKYLGDICENENFSRSNFAKIKKNTCFNTNSESMILLRSSVTVLQIKGGSASLLSGVMLWWCCA
jgi:hypothetical protein